MPPYTQSAQYAVLLNLSLLVVFPYTYALCQDDLMHYSSSRQKHDSPQVFSLDRQEYFPSRSLNILAIIFISNNHDTFTTC
jgi:hypothetical protein